MSFVAWQESLRKAMPQILANPDNHKHSAVIRHGYLMADRHGWSYVHERGSLTRKRDASPLGNFQSAAQYFMTVTEIS